MPEIVLQPGFPPALVVALALTAAIAAGTFYLRVFPAIAPGQWLSLIALRCAAIGLLTLLLLRPVLYLTRELDTERSVVLAIDRSQSMSVQDDPSGTTRLEQARAKLLAWWPRLSQDFRVRVLAFGESVAEIDNVEQLTRLEANAESTSLHKALSGALGIAPAPELEAVFLLTDGIHTAAGDPLEAVAGFRVPVHTIGVGNSLGDPHAQRDVRVTGLDCPAELPLANLARLKAYVEASNLAGQVVPVTLTDDDEAIGQQELVLDAIEGDQEVTFEVTPTRAGLHTYAVGIPALPEEKIPQNNARSASALVIEPRIRLLYLEGTLRAEYGALVGQVLSRDPDLEFCALVQTRPNVFLARTNAAGIELQAIPGSVDEVNAFNVFMLGDLDSSYFRPEQLEWIRARVHDGAGLIMLGGYHSLGPGGYGASPLAEVLPLDLGGRDVGQVDEPFVPQVVLEGRGHPIFANIAEFFPSAEAPAATPLPPLTGCVRVLATKPGAEVLVIHPHETVAGGGPLPVLAVQRYGAGRAAVFTADTTRHWHQNLKTEGQPTPFARFWGQTVRWLAGRAEATEETACVRAMTDKAYYEPEATVSVHAAVRGEEGLATQNAVVVAQVRSGGKTWNVPLAAEPGPGGNYQGPFRPDRSGRYQIVVSARCGEQELTSETLSIEVGRPYLEFDRLPLDEKMLRAIADRTGGHYAHLTVADRLLDGLERRRERQRVEWSVSLAWPPVLWTMFVGALVLEWTWRKRLQLR